MKGLEFHVENRNQPTKIHASFKEAAADALQRAVSHGEEVTIDVVTWTRAAARAWGGDAAAEVYDEDPEASVHERIVLRAESRGRIA